ncbi:protein hinderin isoform X1 [Esox lucius]|uniref:Protein hinderin n=1 Tax=Esox lucius TaxID=8010 RepID=A0AAY5KKC9_ESOLU|nr:protein hinderin isoform X1 [Esox lucius]
MAAASTGNHSGFVWINDTSDEDQPVYIPGVSRTGNLRTAYKSGSCNSERKVKMRAKYGSEIQAEAPLRCGRKKLSQPLSMSSVSGSSIDSGQHLSLPAATIPPPSPATQHCLLKDPKALSVVTQAKSRASLKDLCPEDKRRIASLIQELARVSEEKEESVQRLRNEQETFERKILQLEQQNQLIVLEREGLQQQYRECQELLGLYQQYLSQQQEKLNQSIAQLSHAHKKAPSSEGGSTKPSKEEKATAWDGSYLGLPTAGGSRPNGGEREKRDGSGGMGRVLPLSPASPSASPYSAFSDRSHGPVRHCVCQGRGVHSEPRPSSSPSRRDHLVSGGFPHRNKEDPQLRNTSPRCHNGPGEPPEDSRGVTGPQVLLPEGDPAGEGVGAQGALTAPLLGREDWEERRHRLLLQKMQLEVERERLQARLAQQETRLIRQNQELRHTRLDYNRFQQATAAELGHSLTRNGADPLPNSHAPLSEMRGCDDAWGLAETAEPEIPPQKDTLPMLCHEARRDMATSPLVSQSGPDATPVPVTPTTLTRTPHARLDSSLIELLQVFSPISGPEQNRPTSQREYHVRCPPPLSTPKPARQTLLSPSGRYWAPEQDLEESQILEDIFFIC